MILDSSVIVAIGPVARILRHSPFLPILQAGEILHVARIPPAGCGRLEVRLPAGTVSRPSSYPRRQKFCII